jgi:hypothetical protein
MRCLISTVLIILISTGCRRPSSPVAAIPPLPVIAIEDVPSPTSPSVIVAQGSNLGAIAATAYGHERFAGFVAAVNGITDPGRIAARKELRTPSLSFAFRDAGLNPRYQPAVNALSKACTDYYAAEPAYLKARDGSGVSSGTFPIPEGIRVVFLGCADTIEAAIAVLQAAKPPDNVPKMTIDQFQQVSGLIRELASGSVDGYGYDHDMVASGSDWHLPTRSYGHSITTSNNKEGEHAVGGNGG